MLQKLALVLLGIGISLAAAPPTGLAQPPIPSEAGSLAISVDDKVTTAAAGDTVDYEVTLRNSGPGGGTAQVELTLPVGARLVDVRNGGESPEPWYARWTVEVPADGQTTVSASFVVGPPVPEAKGYAGTACVVHQHVRLICATDIDQIPGAADIDAAVPGEAEDGNGRPGWLLPTGLATVLLIAVIAALWVRQRSAARGQLASADRHGNPDGS